MGLGKLSIKPFFNNFKEKNDKPSDRADCLPSNGIDFKCSIQLTKSWKNIHSFNFYFRLYAELSLSKNPKIAI